MAQGCGHIPCRTCRPHAEPTGTLDLVWQRRTRIDGDTWQSLEVPLGEDTEQYSIKISQGPTTLRETTTTTPDFSYSAAMQIADGASGDRHNRRGPSLATLWQWPVANLHCGPLAMRRCLPGDLFEAAALVAASTEPGQPALIARLLDQADAAHRYAKHFGRAHPAWGNGSLMARALAEPGPRHTTCHSHRFLSALALVAVHLATHKRRCGTG